MPWKRPVNNKFAPTGRMRDPKNAGRRQAIQWLAKQAGIRQPMAGPVAVMFVARFAIPKSKAKQIGTIVGGITPYTDTPDLDNILKLTLDSLNGIAWVDDRQVSSVHCYKRYVRYGEEPHIRVCIMEDTLSVDTEVTE